jgi:hypothetical protein
VTATTICRCCLAHLLTTRTLPHPCKQAATRVTRLYSPGSALLRRWLPRARHCCLALHLLTGRTLLYPCKMQLPTSHRPTWKRTAASIAATRSSLVPGTSADRQIAMRSSRCSLRGPSSGLYVAISSGRHLHGQTWSNMVKHVQMRSNLVTLMGTAESAHSVKHARHHAKHWVGEFRQLS